VAHGAHIGGFLAGLAVAFALNRVPAFQRRHPDDSSLDAKTEEVGRRLQARDPAAAAAVYGTLGEASERALVAGEDLLAIGDFLLEQGDFGRALVLYRRFIAERPNDGDLDRAYLGAGKAALHLAQGATAATHYFLSALDVARSSQTASEARGYLARIKAETADEAAGR
jgi:tetratricopeptide (TPR) repeat protein